MGRSGLAYREHADGLPSAPQLVDATHRLYNARYGCGPSEINFELDERGRLVCTMQDLLTPEEREKVNGRVGERLRDQRLFVRHADTEVIEVIEQLTGQHVRAVASRIDPAGDSATEVFTLGSAYRDMGSV